MMKLNDKYEASEKIYFHMIDKLPENYKKLFIKPDSVKGTINTDLGTDLYYGIEDILAEYCEEMNND